MNVNDEGFTVEAVRSLLASKDDSRNRQLRVFEDGTVELSDVVGNRDLTGVKFRFETWGAGNGYCGPEAARKDSWVKEVHKDIKTAWDLGLSGYIDYPPEAMAKSR